MKKKIIKEPESLLISDENGIQKLEVSQKTHRYPAEPPYVKLYLGDILRELNGLPASHTEVLFQLLNYVTYTDNDSPMTVFINSQIKRNIIENTSIRRIQTIDNVLSQLVQRGILIRPYRGTYQFNPHIFGKGD